MVIASCVVNIHKCIIYHINQNVSADAERYHTCLYVECTMIYDHICIQFWRSVSVSGHGNLKFDMLTRPTRVRIRPGQCTCLTCSLTNELFPALTRKPILRNRALLDRDLKMTKFLDGTLFPLKVT